MAAMKAAYEAALDKARALWAALDAEGHHLAGQAKAAYEELRGDAPALEHEAEQDAAHVVTTAETQGVVPAEHEAAAAAEHLGAEAAHDVETAVADAAHTPQQVGAVIAGETAVADTAKGH